MGIRTKERAKLLLLRKRVMIDEAPYIIIEKIGGLYHDALSLLLEAVEDNSIHADIKPELAFNLADGYYEIADSIDAGKTTVMTADLLAWLEPMAQSINQPEAPPVSTPQPAPASEPETCAASYTAKAANHWDEHNLQRLLSESREPGATHKKLAEQYKVSRQRIAKLLNDAKPKRASPFDSLKSCNNKK